MVFQLHIHIEKNPNQTLNKQNEKLWICELPIIPVRQQQDFPQNQIIDLNAIAAGSTTGRKHFQVRQGDHCRNALAEPTWPFYFLQTPARLPLVSVPNQNRAPSCTH